MLQWKFILAYDGLGSALRQTLDQGTRLDAATVRGRFASGDKIEDIQEYSRLTRDQVMAALAYAMHVAEHLSPAISPHDHLAA
jgi:hypothetical protein